MVDALDAMGVKGYSILGSEAGRGTRVLVLPEPESDAAQNMAILADPIDGRALLAHGYPGAISVIAAAPFESLWLVEGARYMQKLVVDAQIADSLVPECLDAPAAWTLALIARALDKQVGNLTIFMLDRPRHADLIREVRATGAHVMLRAEGDVTGVLLAATRQSGVDALLGTGGFWEGLISACAIKALGGAMLGRIAPQSERELQAVQEAGADLTRIVTKDDLVSADDVFFAATGITDGPVLSGVGYRGGRTMCNSIILRGRSGTRRIIQTEHRLSRQRVSGRTSRTQGTES
jgi:fructose-1,6-bisphosphatase II